MVKPGRKTVRNQATEDNLTAAFQRGASVKIACDYAGLDVATFYRWTNADAQFAARIARVRSRRALDSLERIKDAGKKGNVYADQWFLERHYPEDYGAKTIIRLEPDQVMLLKRYGLTPGQAMELLIQQLAEAQQDG